MTEGTQYMYPNKKLVTIDELLESYLSTKVFWAMVYLQIDKQLKATSKNQFTALQISVNVAVPKGYVYEMLTRLCSMGYLNRCKLAAAYIFTTQPGFITEERLAMARKVISIFNGEPQ